MWTRIELAARLKMSEFSSSGPKPERAINLPWRSSKRTAVYLLRRSKPSGGPLKHLVLGAPPPTPLGAEPLLYNQPGSFLSS